MKSFPINKGSFAGIGLALFLIISVIAPYGCSNSPFDGLKEGKVIYDVTYEGGENVNPMVKAMMPDEITCYFGNNKTCMVISGAMNMMETKMISDASALKYTTLVSAMGRKIAMVMNEQQVRENYADRVELKVEYTDETKEIAGVPCKKVMITDSTDNSYPIYFTEDLAIDNPNWSTPFREIEGFLMEYSIRFGGMVMNLKAREIVNEKHDPALFIIPDDYEMITDPKEMGFKF